MRRKLLALTLCALTSTAALAAGNPWEGTWKLDVGKSHFSGTTFSYTQTADGKMVYDDGSGEPFTFAIDGKPYTDAEGDTHTWTTAGDNAWDSVAKHGDTEIRRAHRVLSQDGKTFNMTFTGTKPDGTTFSDSVVYTRVSGSGGMEGTWRSTRVNISSPGTWTITYPSTNTFQWEFPDYKQTVTGKMDGTDAQIGGPTVPPSISVSVKQISPTKFTSAWKNNNKILGVSEDTLSADGKMITEISWTPGKESEKQTAIYIKQ